MVSEEIFLSWKERQPQGLMPEETSSAEGDSAVGTPRPGLSETHAVLAHHSKFISDNFDKLYNEIELLKVRTTLNSHFKGVV